MTDRVFTLKGALAIRPWGEGEHDTLYCGKKIVAEWAMDKIGGGEYVRASVWGDWMNLMTMSKEECERKTRECKTNRWVSVRYWIADKEAPVVEIQKRALEQLYGVASIEWGARYSEVTGYLWTDESFNVGGHDMIGELGDSVGKFLVLELTVHDGPKPSS